MTTDTTTIITAMRILAEDIQSDDGVANGAIYEAANRLEELQAAVKVLHGLLHQTQSEFVPSTDAACQLNYDALTKYEWMTK